MNEQGNNGKGIFYGVIGVATLIVAIIGATFAYFTATQSNNNVIKGNAATISFGLAVNKMTRIDETKGGLIPMTDGMVGAAVTASTPCQDEAGNAVCQIYRIRVSNTGSAIIFLDGYVTLTGGAPGGSTSSPTTMRWAQVFTADEQSWTLNGTPALANGQSVTNLNEINLTFGNGSALTSATTPTLTTLDTTSATAKYTLNGIAYDYISKNYMRSSTATGALTRSSTDNALVFSQRLAASTDATNSVADNYIVVWLSETGADQTLGSDLATSFFNGTVNFQSGAGAEVSATFNGYARTTATS